MLRLNDRIAKSMLNVEIVLLRGAKYVKVGMRWRQRKALLPESDWFIPMVYPLNVHFRTSQSQLVRQAALHCQTFSSLSCSFSFPAKLSYTVNMLSIISPKLRQAIPMLNMVPHSYMHNCC